MKKRWINNIALKRITTKFGKLTKEQVTGILCGRVITKPQNQHDWSSKEEGHCPSLEVARESFLEETNPNSP